jgi:transcriptional regulator with XRE-family HTH domain
VLFMAVPNRLRALRKSAGLTLPQLAVEIGVDPTTAYRWETSRVGIPDERKAELAEKFDVSIAHLMCWPCDECAERDAA